MKKLILFCFMAAAFITTYAQKMKQDEVPVSVVQAFSKLYPNTKVAEWEKEDGNYEAHFKNNNAGTSVTLNATGTLLETETEIKITDLPKAALSYISKKYPGETVKEATKIVTANGVTTFEAELKTCDLIFDSTGKFLKKEAEEKGKN